jgi:hypothetical protein
MLNYRATCAPNNIVPTTVALLSTAIAACLTVLAHADEPRVREFMKDGLNIQVIGKNADADEERAYQVVVANELRTLSRLEVNRDGLVTDAWITDLDADGAFEIIVATAQIDGGAGGGIDIHEWHEYRFESISAAGLDAAAQASYRGHDRFQVENGRLIREFPLFSVNTGDANAIPSGGIARFEYEASTHNWRQIR